MEEYDAVQAEVRRLDDGKVFGPECLSMRERVSKYIFYQIASGMQYMHEVANVVNRDIKPDNMLFMTSQDGTDHKGDRAQIADFTTVLQCPENDPEFKISGDMGTPVF